MIRYAISLCASIILGCGPRAARPEPPPIVEGDPEIEVACRTMNQGAVPECRPNDEGPGSRLFDSAVELYHDARYEEAVTLFTEIIGGVTYDGGCALQKAIMHRGRALYRLGRYREAFDDFVRFVQAGPDSFYYSATAKWIKALRPHLPASSIDLCIGRYTLMCQDFSP